MNIRVKFGLQHLRLSTPRSSPDAGGARIHFCQKLKSTWSTTVARRSITGGVWVLAAVLTVGSCRLVSPGVKRLCEHRSATALS